MEKTTKRGFVVLVLLLSVLGCGLSKEATDYCSDPGQTFVGHPASLKISHRCLNMSNSNITKLDNNTFSSQWSTKTLDLSRNLISELPPLVFDNLIYLEFLDLSHNMLTSLPGEIFKTNSQMREIDLSHNALIDVPLQVFNYSFHQLRLVDMSHNFLVAFEPWSYVWPGVTSRHLDLQWNNISRFDNSHNLVIGDQFKVTVYNLITNDLRNNQLQRWDDNYLFQYFNGPKNIEDAVLTLMTDIRANPWLCDCHMFHFRDTIVHSILLYSKHKFTEITCQDPPLLRNKRVFFDVTADDLVCNVTQNCPEECFCQTRPSYKVLHIDCRGKGLTTVPRTFPDSPYGRTELLLDDNRIKRFDTLNIAKQISTFSIRNNSLSFINGSVVKDIATNPDARVDISFNLLTSLPEEIDELKHQYTKVNGNRFKCSCDMLWMVDWLNKPPKAKNPDSTLDLTCTFKGDVHRIIDLTEDILECIEAGSLLLILILTGLLAAVLVLLITAKRCPYETKVLIYKIFRIHPADKYIVDQSSDDIHYDMYVSFDEEDPYLRQWVKRVLVRRLEMNKPFYRLSFSCKHLPSGPEAEARLDLMEQSKRMLIILSEGFEANKWLLYESSQSECLEHIDGRIIYLLYDKHAASLAQQEPWKSRIQGRKCFRLGERMMWSKLRYELPVKPTVRL